MAAERSNEHAVVIAGGGPTGLMPAAELALADIDVIVVERRATQDLDGSRAGGLHARTIAVLDQRRDLIEHRAGELADAAHREPRARDGGARSPPTP